MEQLELNFGEGFEPASSETWGNEDFTLANQPYVDIDTVFDGWAQLMTAMVREEMPYAVIPDVGENRIRLYYSKEHEGDFNAILREAYAIARTVFNVC